jgi:hypothetical protein
LEPKRSIYGDNNGEVDDALDIDADSLVREEALARASKRAICLLGACVSRSLSPLAPAVGMPPRYLALEVQLGVVDGGCGWYVSNNF